MAVSILVLCTGNTCRSQMAEAILKTLAPDWEVYSAGTEPGERVHPKAVAVMREWHIDVGENKPKDVKEFLDRPFDYVITVCDEANETCPVFTGRVKQRLHIGFEDPAQATGTDAEVMEVFRRVRNGILVAFFGFYRDVSAGR